MISLPQDPAALALLSDGRPDFEERYWAPRLDFDRADLSEQEYWSRVLGRPITGAELARLVRIDVDSWSLPNEETLKVVAEAAADGHGLALLSNAPICVADGLEDLPFLAAIRPRFFSGRLRMTKPDAAIFRHAATALGVPPGEIVFVDDRLENVASAEAMGMIAIHFRDAATLREDLFAALHT
ncbi:HAD-IA family hydrolase [Streptosporangiaceae bacterium NEAU-GS5]|nr:HAD-IA family hydrolase [Streptosporangiaceae bacterium NEAU-GS5]